MSITVNGTLIPEDTANALTVNGSDITEVWANGVSVWQQQLFAAQWSGDSFTSLYANYPGNTGIGINVSGNLFRSRADMDGYSDGVFGEWLSANTNGTFSGGYSRAFSQNGNNGIAFQMYCDGSNRLYAGGYNYALAEWMLAENFVEFSIANGFTGESLVQGYGINWALQTSGGMLRAFTGNAEVPANYISIA